MDDISSTVMFIATKYQEIYPPDLEALTRLTRTDPEIVIEMEAEILNSLDYKIQPTIELSVVGIIKAELDVKVPAVFDRLDNIIVNGVLIGLLRETRIISTIFGLFHMQTSKLSSTLSSKFEKVCKKYEIDVNRARIDATAFFNLFSTYRASFREGYDLVSN